MCCGFMCTEVLTFHHEKRGYSKKGHFLSSPSPMDWTVFITSTTKKPSIPRKSMTSTRAFAGRFSLSADFQVCVVDILYILFYHKHHPRLVLNYILCPSDNGVIDIAVWHRDRIGSDHLIGRTSVDIEQRLVSPVWMSLKPQQRKEQRIIAAESSGMAQVHYGVVLAILIELRCRCGR